MMKPLTITIYPADLNAYEYMLDLASGSLQAAVTFDRDNDKAIKMMPKLQLAVRNYRKDTGIPLTKQWQLHGTYRDKRKAGNVVHELRKKGHRTMTSLHSNGEVDVYMLDK